MGATRALGCLMLCLAVPARAADNWIEVKTPNFTLVSNAGAGAARQSAWEFEQVRAAYQRLWPWATFPEGRPAVVVLLKDSSAFKPWAPQYFGVKGGLSLGSVAAHGPDREYLLVLSGAKEAGPGVAPYLTLYRSYLHSILSVSVPRPLPVWLSNGLAGVFANVSVRDKEVQLGRPIGWYLRRFNTQARLPLRTILEAERGSSLLLKQTEREGFDAQAWVLVHYLCFADKGAHVPQLNRFIQLWLAGKSQEQALAEAFGDLKELEKQLPLHASRPILNFGRLLADVNLDREKLPVRSVPLAEMLSLRAAVLVSMGRPAEARAALDEARAAEPQAAHSYDAEGLLADRQDQPERATQAFARATELGSNNSYSYYRAARLAWKPEADAAALSAMRKHLERAIEINAQYAPAHSFLAQVLSQQGNAKEALPLALRAVALEPGDSFHHVALARVLQELGRSADARAEAQRGLELADSDWERSNAQHTIDYLARLAGS